MVVILNGFMILFQFSIYIAHKLISTLEGRVYWIHLAQDRRPIAWSSELWGSIKFWTFLD
jgi:hypothetical protein